VALSARGGVPTHAARQLADGLWSGKLGKFVDVEHTLAGLVGEEYGDVVQILGRAGPTDAPPGGRLPFLNRGTSTPEHRSAGERVPRGRFGLGGPARKAFAVAHISRRSKMSFTLRHAQCRQVSGRQWTFTWAMLPGVMAPSGSTMSM
jgi:hypothetical protein